MSWSRLDRWVEGLLARLAGEGAAESLVGDLVEERGRRRSLGQGWWRVGLVWLRDLVTGFVVVARRSGRSAREYGSRGLRKGDGRMQTWLQDVRYAVRSLRSTPGLTSVVVLTLALGIGAGTTVFTVVDNVILNPFPYPEPDRLVGIGPVYPQLGRDLEFWEVLSPAEIEDIRTQAETLDGVVAWDMGNRAVTVGDATENLFAGFWWGDPLPTLGMRPYLGRGFTAEEIERRTPVALLSHRVWSNQFGADSSLVGDRILVNGAPHTLVGVMPPGTLIFGTDLWLPMWASTTQLPRDRRQFQAIARLAPGATLEQARTELALIADRVEREHVAEFPEYEQWSLVPQTWSNINVESFRAVGLALLGAVGFVLLLVCANVASMLLSRSAGRRRDVAVRAALGAGRGRLLRQLLTESLVLAFAGAAAGVVVALLAVSALGDALYALSLPIPAEIQVNARVLGITTVVAAGAGLAFGLVPALYAVRTDLRDMLQSDSHSTASSGRLRLQRMFVGVEVALAFVLLVGGGLLINSFVQMQAVDPGFATEDLLTLRMTLAWERYEEEEMEPFLREVTRRLEEHPAIAGAATATQFPPQLFGRSRFWVEGRELGDEGTLPVGYATIVSPDYFDVLGIPVRQGRALGTQDRAGEPVKVVVNETMARRYFPGGRAVGQRLKLGGPDADGPWLDVVGVVADTRNRGLDTPPQPEFFASIRQITGGNQHFLLVRAPGAVGVALDAVRETVASLDPEQPMYAIQTVEDAFASANAQRRIATTTLSLFGLFALLLAAVGIYAVVAYAVTQRTREIGLRMALGAGRGAVRTLMVRQALAPVVIGGLVGLAGAILVGRGLADLLFEVGGADPATYAAAMGLFGTVALLASYIPARRASRLDPITALREDGG